MKSKNGHWLVGYQGWITKTSSIGPTPVRHDAKIKVFLIARTIIDNRIDWTCKKAIDVKEL